MSSAVQIILNSHVDRSAIEAAIATDGHYYVDVVNNYHYTDAGLGSQLDLADFDATNLEAFLKTVDNATFLIEQDAFVFRIDINTPGEFDLGNSYVRSGLDSSSGSVMPDEQPLKVRFEIPGFATNNFREIDLFFNAPFNPADVALLLEIGIVLTGEGDVFEITNQTDCKVSFSKPSIITDNYVIDFPLANEIIVANP
jgi:hypothetical protein